VGMNRTHGQSDGEHGDLGDAYGGVHQRSNSRKAGYGTSG
jgi:hypothetical protein